jgi:hypothetical protein
LLHRFVDPIRQVGETVIIDPVMNGDQVRERDLATFLVHDHVVQRISTTHAGAAIAVLALLHVNAEEAVAELDAATDGVKNVRAARRPPADQDDREIRLLNLVLDELLEISAGPKDRPR